MMAKYSSAAIKRIGKTMKGLTCFNAGNDFKHTSDIIKKLNINKKYRGVRAGNHIKRTKFTFSSKTSQAKNISIQLLNARSIGNKSDEISEVILDKDLDILVITETWMKKGDTDSFAARNMTPNGYQLLHTPRLKKPGGGVAVIMKKTLHAEVQDIENYSTFETMEVVVKARNRCIRICPFYRAPSTSRPDFLSEFETFLDSFTTKNGELLILGDFNVWYEDTSNCFTRQFRAVLDAIGMDQRVTGKTHEKGHTLDLVLTRQEESALVNNITVSPLDRFDHYTIAFTIPWTKPAIEKQKINFRKIKDIDISSFTQDISDSKLVESPPLDLDELVTLYNSELKSVIDKHAPAIVKEVVLRPHAPWYNEHIRECKVERRRAERKWAKDKTDINKEILKSKQRQVNKLSVEAKRRYYNNKVSAAENNSKELFKVAGTLLSKPTSTSLPSHTTEKDLANKFGKYFSDNISKIRTGLSQNICRSADMGKVDTPCLPFPRMESFAQISQKDLEKIIKGSNSKSCALDPIPTSLLKKVLPVLLPTICKIVNKSLMENAMPHTLKKAIVKPLIKKPTLDKENLKNFRPVSNLPFLGKLIEQVVINQINEHLLKYNLNEPLQSAYTPNHSTETAIVKVTNDILCALDRRQCVCLVLLDLSAAFDTIDHQVFLRRLREDYGIAGGVTDWMESYLLNRTQSVDINGTLSDTIKLEYGFPQGSKIGPFGFKLYTKPLAAIAKKHGVHLHLYADDTQLYLPFDPQNSKVAIEQIEACIMEIKSWMGANFLKLNDEKTECIMFGSQHDLQFISHCTVSVGSEVVVPSKTVRNIGAMLDSTLTMQAHVNNISKSCYYQIRNLSKIRNYLSEESCQTLTHAFVSSRLDNMNALLHGVNKALTKRLQNVQNNAARVVKRQRKSCHITPILKDLHWLPVKYRSQYKILLLVYKCIHGEGPAYLASMLEEYDPIRTLRSSSQGRLREHRTKKNYGTRAFSVAGPRMWNNLDPEVKNCFSVDSFKKSLKTHLFKKAYNLKDQS